MTFLSTDVAYSNIEQGAPGPVSMETAKSQYEFFTINSRRPSIDNDFRFFSTQTTS